MARYIDADELLNRLPNNLPYKGSVKRVLMQAPEADVVPKSEVEELKAIIADHKANEERWQELYADTVDKWEKAYEELEIKLARLNAVTKEMDEQRAYTINMLAESLENAKAEVAREIFEELEKWLSGDDSLKIITANKFSEIKKKYTEGEDEK